MPSLQLVMMGTGDFAEPTFRALYDTPHRVAALVTQPDPTGPGHHRTHVSPLKRLAQERGTQVFQPADVNAPGALDELRALGPDVFVVAAFGQILSPELLQIPRLMAINVHASLLPKHRGASPVAHAILCGDVETGVSIIQVLPRLDAGPILAVARTPIAAHETAGELEDRLANLAVPLVPAVLDQLAGGHLNPQPQPEGLVTRAPKLRKERGAIDWGRSAEEIDRHVRAMQPWPGPFTYIHSAGKASQRIAVLAVRPAPQASWPTARPGTILQADSRGLFVQCGSGAVEIARVQPAGKRGMAAVEYLRGHAIEPGDNLGPENDAPNGPD